MPANTTIPVTTVHGRPDDAWTRWGWLMGGIWLLFFGFPLYHVWGTEHPTPLRLGATALIVAYVASYIATLRMTTGRVARGAYREAARLGMVGLVTLLLLWVALAVLIGANSMTAMPFVVALPVFFLPWRWVWITSLSILAAGVVGSFLAWGLPAGFLWIISVFVLIVSVVSRFLEEKQEASQEAGARAQLSEERERVARDVHDVLGHSLTVVTMKTELARRLVDVDPERAKQEMAEIQDLARTALAEIRATVGGLRVARMTDEVEAARVALLGAGITADLPTDVTVVDPRHRITLAWVLREAVTNVVRHSRATVCRVRLGSDTLVVEDDGRGMQGRREGNGLRGLRERVEQAGGRIEIGPGEGARGTRLEVTL